MDPTSIYKSYILRLWTVTREGQPVWQASLQSTATGQRQGFPDLESLFDHLVVPAGDRRPVLSLPEEVTTMKH